MKYIKTFESKYLNPNKKENNKFNVEDYVRIKNTEYNNIDVFKVKHVLKNYKNKSVSNSDFEYKLYTLNNEPLRFWVNEIYLKLATPEEIETAELNMSTKKYNI